MDDDDDDNDHLALFLFLLDQDQDQHHGPNNSISSFLTHVISTRVRVCFCYVTTRRFSLVKQESVSSGKKTVKK
jgi:hypothetical protein